MNINNVDKMFSFLVNKVQAGNVSPDRRNLAYNLANKIMYRKYFGLPENFVPGSMAISYSVSQQTEEIIRRFKKPYTLSISVSGESNLPDDFVHTSTIEYVSVSGGRQEFAQVKICNDSEFLESKTSYIVPATKENPTCNFMGTKVRFFPIDLVVAQMIYLRVPLTPIWGYTMASNRPVYDVNTSVNPEWPDDLEVEFVVTAAQAAGVNMQRQQLFQEMGAYKNNAT